MRFKFWVLTLVELLAMFGCADNVSVNGGHPPVSPDQYQNVIVKSVYTLDFSVDGGSDYRGIVQATSSVNVSVNNSASNTFSLGSFAAAIIPTQTESTGNVTLGTISVTNVFDNDVKHCGVGLTKKCTTAGIAAYWSTPTVGLSNGLSGAENELMTVKLSSGFASLTALSATTSPGLILNSVIFSQNTVTTARMCAVPANCTLTFVGDFTDRGAGTYTGTVNVVYFLAD